MQPIKEIIKEIGLPVGIMFGFSSIAIAMSVVSGIRAQKSWILPIPSAIFLLVVVGMISYFANDSIKRRKAWAQEKAMWAGQSAAIRSSPIMEEKKTVALDKRLQSIEGIIGYLDQSIKMGQEPKDLAPVILILAKEIKNVRDEK
jgi:hypothetical protein